MLLLLACAEPAPPAATTPGTPGPDVLLVSLDTTRADAIDAETAPHVTALGARGVRFAWALAHAPTTLSSHASVFTGHDPHGHGVVRNGYPLDPALPTLAGRFAAAGWDTLGVAGASVLAENTGISRGFRTWDATFSVDRGPRHEARADEVTDRALALVAKREPGKPLFLFVHYFDAHAPYAAPEPWRRRFGAGTYAGPLDERDGMKQLGDALRGRRAAETDVAELRARYRGEVAWVDSELGRLLDGLALKDPVIAVFGDHGEVLAEEPDRPLGHGGDVDLPATHVPLLVVGPRVPAGGVVEGVVGLSDLGPTLLAAAGLSAGLGDGRDLAPLWRGEDGPRTVFLEATKPEARAAKTGWPNLPLERGVARDARMLIRSPWAAEALYRLAPGQPRAEDPPGAAALGEALDAWDRSAPTGRAALDDAQTDQALRALGYKE